MSATDAVRMANDVGAPPRNELRSPEDSAKRRQILEGAREVFLADGFDSASMNDVARVAGVSKGTLYVYFDNKIALFEALIREERRQQAERICIIYEDEHADLRSVLVRFGVSLVETIVRPASLAQVRTVLAVAARFPRFARVFYESGPQVGLARLVAFFARRVSLGELAIDDLELAAAQLIELYQAGLTKPVMFCMADAPPLEEIERKVAKSVDVFLAAYGRKASG